ncbi:class I SAM-dependent RNA methyltransferase [Algihabitans albus]|uniref:class I SAM-dependent RNA methyltransferase n=1 Tax=Algihabitans albus TaxID=2164067 RepID=UPI000E5CC5FD|nr:class I SAM-dependent RNA methyltransferase [Algihabitans albus]
MRRRVRPGGGRQIDVSVAELGARGDGVAKTGEGLVFVPLSAPGDFLRLRVTGEKKGGALLGEILEILEEGPDRIDPPCPHFGPCGGCQVQHLQADFYHRWKQLLVGTHLSRQGLDPAVVRPLVQIAPGCRRRAVFAARRRGRRLQLGFHEARSHNLVDLTTCLLVTPTLLNLLEPLRAVLALWLPEGGEAEATLVDTETGLDLLVETDVAPDLETREALADFAETRDLARLSWRLRGGLSEPLALRRLPVLSFGRAQVTPPPGAFLQPSREGEAALIDLVRSAIPDSALRVADLYAGLGTFAFALADRARILAYEGDAEALAALDTAARQPSLQGRVAGERRDLGRQPLRSEELNVFDAIVFDPPRAGAPAQVAHISASDVPTVVAVSCNPASFARDARLLVDGGYRLEQITPVDQFPWSSHLELVAVFLR